MLLALSAPPAVAAVAQRYRQTTKGSVAFRLHRVFDVHAGPSSRHDDLVFDAVYADGRLTSVRVVSYTIGGKQADAQQRADVASGWEHPKPQDVFHAPYDPRYASEYSYRSAGPGAIAFTSLVHDSSHGDGTMQYDRRFNLTGISYSPNVMPQYATSGTISDTRSMVLPGYWATTQETQSYRGHYHIFAGGASVTITYSNFRRI